MPDERPGGNPYGQLNTANLGINLAGGVEGQDMPTDYMPGATIGGVTNPMPTPATDPGFALPPGSVLPFRVGPAETPEQKRQREAGPVKVGGA